ncbi:MAG: sarcosine oxidase subunit gamma family protein [Actinomycetota bacterium]
MSDLIGRSPVRPDQPVTVAGWEVTGRRSTASLTLTDLSPLAKAGVRAPFDGGMARALGVPSGRCARDRTGALVTGSGPGEWLVIGPAGAGPAQRQRLAALAAEAAGGDLVTVLDLTHGRALLGLTGQAAAAVLAKLCGIDLADAVVPNGAAFRSSVAKLVTDVVRDDQDSPAGPVPSYLLHCDRSYGQYLFDVLLDAGAEFGIDVDGFRVTG